MLPISRQTCRLLCQTYLLYWCEGCFGATVSPRSRGVRWCGTVRCNQRLTYFDYGGIALLKRQRCQASYEPGAPLAFKQGDAAVVEVGQTLSCRKVSRPPDSPRAWGHGRSKTTPSPPIEQVGLGVSFCTFGAYGERRSSRVVFSISPNADLMARTSERFTRRRARGPSPVLASAPRTRYVRSEAGLL